MINELTKKVILTDDELLCVVKHAKMMELGGKSNIRKADNRRQNLSNDQITSQAGEAALSKLVTGNIELYNQTREQRELNPWNGDGGSDLIGYDIDVKTSRMRVGVNHLYNLWVRPREYHPETFYYLALMEVSVDDTVYFAGWVQGKYIRYDGEKYAIRQDQLNPMTVFDEEEA